MMKYFKGKTLLMEEHPMKDQLLMMMEFLGRGINPDEIPEGGTVSIYKKYGIDDMEPIDRRILDNFDVIMIHVEQNCFSVQKAGDNTFEPGDLVYLLNDEIKEVVHEY